MNIIFILLDDLGWNDVGINNPKIKTPNMCQLSNENGGCILERNYTFSVCGPTRAMIQTGIYAYKYGMQQLLSPWNYYGLDSNLKIIPEYLSEIGYDCFALGKWHLGHNDTKWLPHKRGYKLHYGHLTGCVNHTSHKNCSSNIHDFSCNRNIVNEKGHSCDLITNKAIEIIEKNQNNKFFIYLAYTSPHTPLKCPAEFKKEYIEFEEPRKTYLGMISHLDYNLGKIFNKLKNLKIFDETLIWIQSDNGGWTTGFACGDNYPLKGGKASFYEGGVKAFTLIKDKRISIKKFEGFCHSVDVLPTILDFAECSEIPKNIDGISNKNFFLNNKKIKRHLILSFYSEKFWCFIIENFKFINENNSMSCYDLISDPKEKNNIIDKKYNEFKNIINKTINQCNKEYVSFPNLLESEESIKQKCKNIKFWGQKNKNLISCYSCDNTNSHESFLSLSGYDIFYK